MNRRKFLKASLAGAGVGLVDLNAIPLVDTAVLDTKGTGLTSATHFGAFRAIKNGGRFTGLTPLEDEFPTPMVKVIPDRTYSPTRVKYPYVREGYLKDGYKSDASKRGSDNFVRVSWEKAYELITNEIKRVQKIDKGNSIFAGSYGWKSVGKLHNPQVLLHRFLKLTGGYVGHSADYSTAAAQAILTKTIGSIDVYERQTTYPSIIENAKNVVFWGVDPLTDLQVGWASAAHEFYPYAKKLREVQKEGKVKIFAVDPNVNDTSDFYQASMIKPRPNTDVAMILAMCYTLYKNDMYDKKFIKKNTVGFDKFIDYVLGKEDGVAKTPQWAEKICGVKADDIEKFAKTLKKERTFIMGGWAIQRAEHGEQVPWAIVTLGYIGLPGGGFGFGYHEGSGGSPKHQAVALSGISSHIAAKDAWSDLEITSIPVARIVDMLNNPGSEIDYNGKKVKYPDIKLVYWTGGNPFHHHQDRNKMIKTWQKIQTFIVNEPYWTATARMADIVLPATTEVERTDIEVLGDYSLRGYVGMKKIIEPVGESKDDYEIFRELSKRFGREKEFTEGKTQMQWIQGFYEDGMKKAKEMKLPMSYPSFEEFWKNGYLGFPKPTKESMNWIKMAGFRKNPRRNRLGTPSGKIEIFSKTIDKMNYPECKGHAMWFEPNEWLGSKKAKTYPFHLLSPHPKYRLHSQLNNTYLRHLYEIQEREPISIHPVNAKEKGIKNGDIVRVFNDRGEILAGALVTERVGINTVRIHEGAWYNPLDASKAKTLCVHGDVNVLTQDIPTSKLAQGPSANTALVDFEKFKGVAPKVSVFNAPNIKRS